MIATADEPPSHHGSLAAFRHRGFMLFWVGALVSSTGTWLGNLTVPYVLYQQTGSAMWVGLAAAAQFGPAFVLSPLGGSLADNVDRRVLLMWTQAGLGMVAIAMWVQWAVGVHEPALLIVLVTVFGVLNGLNNPAWQSLVNDLVPREDVLSAVTLNSLQFNMARAIGPALAGVLLATLGASWAFFLNAVSFTVVVVTLVFVRQHRSRVRVPSGRGFLAQWRETVRYMARSQPMLLAIGLCCLVGLFGNPIFTLTVVFAETVYATDAVGLGLLTASLGVGAVLYALAGLIRRGGPPTFSRRSVLAITALGLALVAMGAAPNFGLGAIAAIGVGAAFLAAFATLNSVIQLLAPDSLRGRVLAVRHMVFSASLALGVLLSGILTDAWGVRPTTVLLGLALLLAVAVVVLVPILVPTATLAALLDRAGGEPGQNSPERNSAR
jgi:MFS family permease